jgi:hypothetical protein
MTLLEEPDLLVDIVALRRRGRAKHDQRRRGVKRGKGLLGQGVACGEVVAIAENGLDRLRDRPALRLPTGQIAIDAAALKPAMQPLGLSRVGVAIGDEGAVFERDGLCRSCFDPT